MQIGNGKNVGVQMLQRRVQAKEGILANVQIAEKQEKQMINHYFLILIFYFDNITK